MNAKEVEREGTYLETLCTPESPEFIKTRLLSYIATGIAELNAKTPTLRDQFAMAVMQGDIANRGIGEIFYAEATKEYYVIADAMMKAREAENVSSSYND